MTEKIQNEFGYFGKLPIWGDFVHQRLPQDFANGWHRWLQESMASAREALGESFLTYYLNCPAWKFMMAPGVCGEQAVVGLTIPSVDRVGRYFNFTLATVLSSATNPCTYVSQNKDGMAELENLALDILEQDLPKEDIELKLRELVLHFHGTTDVRQRIESGVDFIRVSQEQALPFADQSGELIDYLVSQRLQNYSMWWYGQAGQTRSQLLVCQGLPSAEHYLSLLTLDDPPEPAGEEKDYIDQIIAGEV
jgi:type VI secretion system protein ImpM